MSGRDCPGAGRVCPGALTAGSRSPRAPRALAPAHPHPARRARPRGRPHRPSRGWSSTVEDGAPARRGWQRRRGTV